MHTKKGPVIKNKQKILGSEEDAHISQVKQMYNGEPKGSLTVEATKTLNLALEVRCSPDEYIHSLIF